jgi:hypothetical protein
MSYAKQLLRTTIIALAIFGTAAGTSTMFQSTSLTFADGSGQHDDYDAG